MEERRVAGPIIYHIIGNGRTFLHVLHGGLDLKISNIIYKSITDSALRSFPMTQPAPDSPEFPEFVNKLFDESTPYPYDSVGTIQVEKPTQTCLECGGCGWIGPGVDDHELCSSCLGTGVIHY